MLLSFFWGAKASSDVYGTAAFADVFSGPVAGRAKGPFQGEDLCLATTPRVSEQEKAQLLPSHPSAAVTHLHLDEESGRSPRGVNRVSYSVCCGELVQNRNGNKTSAMVS